LHQYVGSISSISDGNREYNTFRIGVDKVVY